MLWYFIGAGCKNLDLWRLVFDIAYLERFNVSEVMNNYCYGKMICIASSKEISYICTVFLGITMWIILLTTGCG